MTRKRLQHVDWAGIIQSMRDPSMRERADLAMEQAMSLIPRRHRIGATRRARRERGGNDLERSIVEVAVQRRGFAGWYNVLTSDSSEALTGSASGPAEVGPDTVLFYGRYTGERLTARELHHLHVETVVDADGNESRSEEIHIDALRVQDAVILNVALAAQDLALEFRDGRSGHLRTPYPA